LARGPDQIARADDGVPAVDRLRLVAHHGHRHTPRDAGTHGGGCPLGIMRHHHNPDWPSVPAHGSALMRS